MDNPELTRYWLWMQTMEYVLSHLKWKYKNAVYPREKENEWGRTSWEEMQGKIFTYILNHWETQEFHGNFSSPARYEVGHNLQVDSSGVVGKYKDMEVLITWTEVKQFMRKMLAGEPDKQLNLFELLAREAMV